MVCVILIIQVARFRRRRFGLIRRLRIERLMGSWINSLAYQLLTQSESVWEAMEAENEIFLIRGDLATFNRRAEVVHPAETAAFSTAEKTSFLGSSSSSGVHGPLFNPTLTQHGVDFAAAAAAPAGAAASAVAVDEVGFLISKSRIP
uniref:Uncharacterized protein n=1 Tax=Salix viminalis TaxID=40686 RepID=A0A6N2K7N3_SALVM